MKAKQLDVESWERDQKDMMSWTRKHPADVVANRVVADGYTIETTHDMREGAAWVSPCGKYVVCNPWLATQFVEYLKSVGIHRAEE